MDNLSLGSDLFSFDCTTPISGFFQSGEGSLSNPYVICSEEQLMMIDDSSQNLQSNYVLGRDLDFQSFSFEPIGRYDRSTDTGDAFSGNFNGNNLTISNINFTAPNDQLSTGFFGYTSEATINSLNLSSINLTGDWHTGFLIGRGENTSVENINIIGDISNANLSPVMFRIGGVVGQMILDIAGSYYIRDISIDANIEADDNVGLIYGHLFNNSTPGVNFSLENVNTNGDVVNANNNTVAGVGGFTVFEGDNVSLVYRNINHTGDVNIIGPVGGSWSGLMFGQFDVRGGNNMSLIFEDVSVSGNLNSVANWNQRGVLGAVMGDLTITGATNSNYLVQRVSAEADINIIASASPGNNDLGGFIGRLEYENTQNISVNISNSYFKGTFSSPNANDFNGLGGMIGEMRANAATVNPSVSIENSYAQVNANAPSATIVDSAGIVGEFYSGTEVVNISNVYFVSATGVATPVGNAGATELSSAQLLQNSSFAGFDFSSVWSIENGVSSPVLR